MVVERVRTFGTSESERQIQHRMHNPVLVCMNVCEKEWMKQRHE